VVSALIATPLLTTTSVMLVTVALPASAITCSHLHIVRKILTRLKHRTHNRASNYVAFQ
jgi:hypothetical protein